IGDQSVRREVVTDSWRLPGDGVTRRAPETDAAPNAEQIMREIDERIAAAGQGAATTRQPVYRPVDPLRRHGSASSTWMVIPVRQDAAVHAASGRAPARFDKHEWIKSAPQDAIDLALEAKAAGYSDEDAIMFVERVRMEAATEPSDRVKGLVNALRMALESPAGFAGFPGLSELIDVRMKNWTSMVKDVARRT
ncbi:MAG: hypothetical protein ACYDAG_16600, partial [Chloroflexota bacterium]